MRHPAAPTLRRNFSGFCVVCLRGTDTALAFTGSAEWHLAGLLVLGVPEAEVVATCWDSLRENGWAGTFDRVPEGRFTQSVRVCADCVGRASVPLAAPGHAPFGVPSVTQP